MLRTFLRVCAINSKINGTPKGVYLPISKLLLILAVVNLLAHNNLRLCYYVQVNLLREVNTFGGTIYFAVDGTCVLALVRCFFCTPKLEINIANYYFHLHILFCRRSGLVVFHHNLKYFLFCMKYTH